MTESAYEWGVRHGSCDDALEARLALGPHATQATWWRRCPRGDWLAWQWYRLPQHLRDETRSAMDRAMVRIVSRAIRRARRLMRRLPHRSDAMTQWISWAQAWLSGDDRSHDAATLAWDVVRLTSSSSLVVVSTLQCTAYAAWTAAALADDDVDAVWYRYTYTCNSAEQCAAHGAYARSERARVGWSTDARRREQRRQARDIRGEIPMWPGGRG